MRESVAPVPYPRAYIMLSSVQYPASQEGGTAYKGSRHRGYTYPFPVPSPLGLQVGEMQLKYFFQ